MPVSPTKIYLLQYDGQPIYTCHTCANERKRVEYLRGPS